MYSIYFTDDNNGWASGYGGTILHTENGGNTWSSQTSGTTNILYSIYFTDDNNGWAVGMGGTILHTENGGTNWSSQTSGTTNALNYMYFTDDNNGWAVGYSGIILHTENGGTNWSSQTSGTTNILYSIYFTDNNNGWAAGTDGIILSTINGGDTWTSSTVSSPLLVSIHFTDNKNGWASGIGGTIFNTTDGGNTWTAQNSKTTLNLLSIYFTDANNGWVAGTSGTILKIVPASPNAPDTGQLLQMDKISLYEGATAERTITHSYDKSEITEFILTLADDSNKPDWIRINNNTITVAPSYDVVESSLAHKSFSFRISTVNKTPNTNSEFTVVVINNLANPITYDNSLNSETINEDDTEIYNILAYYTSEFGTGLELTHNYLSDGNYPNWVSFTSGSIRVMPGNNEVGTHNIPFKVTDIIGNKLTGTLELTVIGVNDAPTTLITRTTVTLLEDLKCSGLENSETSSFNLSTVFSDVDSGDVLTYELITDDDPNDEYEGVVRNVKILNPDFVEINGSMLNFNFSSTVNNDRDYRGFYHLGIKATDKSNESVTYVITLQVGSYYPSTENDGLIVMTDCPKTTDNLNTFAKSKSAKSRSVILGGYAISNGGQLIEERGVIYSSSASS